MADGDMPCVLGVDGGGTKTAMAVCARNGRVLARWTGIGTNPFDRPEWQGTLATLLDVALRAGAPVAAAAGVAGYGELPEISALQEQVFATHLSCRHTLHNDVQVAFDGAFLDEAGVLMLAGTGSMAWAQAEDGVPVRVGGWGHGIGDAGSAYWIGQHAVATVSRVLDGRAPDQDFARSILAAIGVAGDAPVADASEGLLRWYETNTHRRSATAALARVVDELAGRGDAAAVALLGQAADELCLHVVAARRRIGLEAGPWSYAGSLFASATLQCFMRDRLGEPQPPALPPIGGALWRAARLAGWAPDRAWVALLAASLQETQSLSHHIESPNERH